MSARVEVAVGVLCRSDGALLVQERREGTACAGQWEFPGGKQEPGETIEAALARELNEELGVVPLASTPLTVLEHDYAHAAVRLHTFLVFEWQGEVSEQEGQRTAWLPPEEIRTLDLLEAAYPLLDLAEAALAARST